MLKRLTITNLAIIENVDIVLKDGFTVLTGATGAGKSLIIDSLSLLLGARASSELIRTGEDKATISGLFEIHNSRLEALLTSFDIPFTNNELLVERTIGVTKNYIKANGAPVSLNQLSQISLYLADIHNQFDFEKILNPDNYLGIIDGFSYELITNYKNEYAALLSDYQTKKHDYDSIVDKKNKLDESRDFYEFQYNELKDADLKSGEEDSIASELSLLKHYDEIYSLTKQADDIIHDDFLDKLYDLNKILAKLASFQEKYKETHDKLDDRYYEINDIFTSLKKDFASIDYDPDRLNVLEQRDSDLSALKRKYRKSIPELISYRDELASLVGKDSHLEEEIETKKKAKEDAFLLAFKKGEELSAIRKKVASNIEKELEKNLADLLLKAKFKITFNEPKESDGDLTLKANGIDTVDFLIETNTGEGLKSLSKIVSGGEASRLMLAFKTIYIKANKVSTIIFDEIDTGISGEVAYAVAKKIHEISLYAQVIAITHMPQVASFSDHHILISKEVKNGRTFTHMKELDLQEKIKEVANLISGGKITEKQLEYAKEMVMAKRD
jgi:DNA repair protein RecN (Recombination protein N)